MKRIRINVFVYGTLKRDRCNHERFCQGLLTVEEATVQGQLYELPYGFPALVVPEEDVHATGTTNYLTDSKKQHYIGVKQQEGRPGWDTIYGELFTFDDPEERLPALDELENFRPGEKSLYKRVLIPTTLVETGTTVLAWTYTVESVSGVYLRGGSWPAY